MTTTRKTKSQPKPKPLTRDTATPDQWRCIEVVANALRTHECYLKPYPCGKGIRVSFLGDVATYDGNLLTRLVLAAHRYAVRISVVNSGPRRVAIEAHPRDPNNMCTMKGHPSLEDLKDMADAWQLMEEIAVADPKGGPS